MPDAAVWTTGDEETVGVDEGHGGARQAGHRRRSHPHRPTPAADDDAEEERNNRFRREDHASRAFRDSHAMRTSPSYRSHGCAAAAEVVAAVAAAEGLLPNDDVHGEDGAVVKPNPLLLRPGSHRHPAPHRSDLETDDLSKNDRPRLGKETIII